MLTRRTRAERARHRALAVAAISLGCPKNLVDTEVMLGLLRQAGFSVVVRCAEADVLLVNTCCFIEAARQESAEALQEAVAWRREGKAKALICAGCWPQADSTQLRVRFPEIDALMGPGDVPHVASVVQSALRATGSRWNMSSPSTYLYDDATPRLRATPPWTAYLKIAEGCNHRCSFCVVPRLRGRFRSRPLGSVVREARQLSREGVLEINLVAQDTTAYGCDLGAEDTADLLSALGGIETTQWIRLLYGFPGRITKRVIEAMACSPKICRYIDVPFQHGDRGILQRMGRPADGDRYLRLIDDLRAAMPDIAIRSTFLVGFPGEGEAQFRRLLEFIEAAQFDRAGAFCYSREEQTRAARMPGQVAAEVAQERYHQVMSLQQRVSLARNRRWVGRELEVLVEGKDDTSGGWLGRSFRDAPEIDGLVLIQAAGRRLAPGQLVRVKILRAHPYDLVATTRLGANRSTDGLGRRR